MSFRDRNKNQCPALPDWVACILGMLLGIAVFAVSTSLIARLFAR